MEATKYLFLFILLILSIIYGFYVLIRSKIEKNKTLVYFGISFIVLPLLVGLFIVYPNFLTKEPTLEDLFGTYCIATAENDIPNSEFQHYTLTLKSDETFEMTPTPGISLCEKGNFDFEKDLITFQCGVGWSPTTVKRKYFDFEIVFYDGDKEICFKKND